MWYKERTDIFARFQRWRNERGKKPLAERKPYTETDLVQDFSHTSVTELRLRIQDYHWSDKRGRGRFIGNLELRDRSKEGMVSLDVYLSSRDTRRLFWAVVLMYPRSWVSRVLNYVQGY